MTMADNTLQNLSSKERWLSTVNGWKELDNDAKGMAMRPMQRQKQPSEEMANPPTEGSMGLSNLVK